MQPSESMRTSRKWIVFLGVVILIGLMFAEKIVYFYIDLLWFAKYGYRSVFLTMLTAQFGCGLAAGGLVFFITHGILRLVYHKTSHLPVVLADDIRREIPLLDLIARNLRPLVLLAPLLIGGMTGLVASQQWELVLKYLNAVAFNQADPIFGNDYSFYLFTLPLIALVKTMLWEVWVVSAVGIGLIYFFKQAIALTPSGFVFEAEARRAISLLAGFAFLLLAANFYVARFEMLWDGSGVVAGITYADDHGRLPVFNLSIVLACVAAAVSFLNVFMADFRKIFLAGAVLGVVYIGGNFYPTILQKFIVAPNELIKETPYIEHTISATNRAFGLDKVEAHELTGTSALSAEAIKANSRTIENIRLWDREPLLDTLGQIQEIRTYYQFAAVDNDRYNFNGVYRQTLLSPRELDSSSLPNRTWINEHLTFTHGYGVALTPVHQVTPEGLPVLLIKDIPPQSSIGLQVTQPEIYFGELASNEVFVNTGTKEFDYPEGAKNVYKNYEGEGGIFINSFFRKMLLAARFKTLKIIFSQDIHNDSRVLMYRNITSRVEKVAPFLTLDRDPYLVISHGRLFWMYDAYTTSDQFPYSQKIQGIGNYIRNSVKIVVDAYNGSLDFYIVDPEDPVILAYRNIFPGMFKKIGEMPEDLRNHLRYPTDLFTIQTFIYTTYHMKTPQVFYNKEDQWEVPEIDNAVMQPYYTIMRLPGKKDEEYILMLPFTPRGKGNLSAWMVGRSDGEDYGKLVVYTFPKQSLVYGPNQIVARINQDAEISRQISLWDQRGSSVIQGNLLVIPIEESLIYVRPLYLKADAGKIPELKRVIVGYEDQIAMEPTLDQALQKIFRDLPVSFQSETKATEPTASISSPRAETDTKIVLKQSDFRRIKQYFQRALESQKRLDKNLAAYRQELEALGNSLDAVRPVEEAAPREAKGDR
ncbi:MAG: UPF0182 family protein [Nitrospinales bacterium]